MEGVPMSWGTGLGLAILDLALIAVLLRSATIKADIKAVLEFLRRLAR